MKITKKNGSLVMYDDEKVKKSILKANATVTGETISEKTAMTLADTVFDRLTEKESIISTAEIRDCVYALLKERSFPKTAEAYWAYKKDRA